MQNAIQIFENREFGQLGVLMIDGKPFFPAVECAEVLGYSKPHNAVSRHCPHSLKRGVGVQTGSKADGTPAFQTVDKAFIPEGDLYRLIIRSKLPTAIKFERWVFDEVLPSIRKHGAYINEDVIRRMQEDSEYNAELLRNLAAEQMRNTALINKVASLAPKAHYHDVVLQCPDAMQISLIAKDYGMTATALNKLLHSMKIQHKIGGVWVLYKEHQSFGYTKLNTYTKNGVTVWMHTCWTQRGRLFLYEQLKAHGILPIIEQMSADEQLSLNNAV